MNRRGGATPRYSALRFLTGFAIAARITRPLTVMRAIATTADPASRNIPTPIRTWYANPRSHSLISHHATGDATKSATPISTIDSRHSIDTRVPTFAPSNFRILISFARFSTVNNVNPSKPIQEIKIANPTATFTNVSVRRSFSYNFASVSS